MKRWQRRRAQESSPPQTPAPSGSASSRSDHGKIFNLAREFGGELQYVLNASVCHDASIKAQPDPNDRSLIAVGNRLTKESTGGEPIPLGKRGKPRGWLKAEYLLRMDDAGKYLMVMTAFVGIYAADESRTPLCHFDYERNKTDGYPEAHIQVYGASTALDFFDRKSSQRLSERGLHRLHLPAGHRRFRWIIEDVVEFLIAEHLVEPHGDDWREILAPGRSKFLATQLRAAIRNDLETTLMFLSEQGYAIYPPKDL